MGSVGAVDPLQQQQGMRGQGAPWVASSSMGVPGQVSMAAETDSSVTFCGSDPPAVLGAAELAGGCSLS